MTTEDFAISSQYGSILSLYCAYIFLGSLAITGVPGYIETELHKAMEDMCNK